MIQRIADEQAVSKSVTSQADVAPRVLLVIRRFPPDIGGSEIQAYRLATCLAQKGVPVTVLTGRYGGRLKFESLDGVPVHRLFIGAYIPILHEVCFLLSLARELIFRRNQYDIVHLFQTQLGTLIAVIVAKRLGKRVVTRVGGAGSTGDMAMWHSIWGGKWLLQHVQKAVDRVVAVSDATKRELLKAGFQAEKVHYIPNGLDVDAFYGNERRPARACMGLPPHAFKVVYVGRLSKEKGPDLLLDAWLAVQPQHPDMLLVFVGDGDLRAELDVKTKQYGIDDRVIFTGNVENVVDYLQTADVFVLPSINEGLSNALLEAMAAGLPIVASRVSGTEDVIEHDRNGLLFESGDVNGMANCLLSLIEDPQRRERLGQEAHQTVKNRFSMETIGGEYVALYRSLMREL